MSSIRVRLLLCIAVFVQCASAQPFREPVDTAAVARFKQEGFERSQAMTLMSYLTDVCGQRLTGSPEFALAADWAKGKFSEWKLDQPRIETWGPFGRGWALKRFSVHMTEPRTVPLIGVPKAWSPGTRGTVTGPVVFFTATNDSELVRFHGKLKGAFVLVSEARNLKINYKPLAERHSDETLLKLANADVSPARRREAASSDTASYRKYRESARFEARKIAFCRKEKALALIDVSRGDGGTVMTGAAAVPQPDSGRVNAYDVDASPTLPQVTLTAEHYNRIMRVVEKGIPVTLEMNLEVEFTDAAPGINVLAEIPGTDLKDEIVMIGAHLDSWHGGGGAADNGSGVITCMEAIRILKASGLAPRRTIRIALWGGEEEGLLGSKAYVSKYLAERAGDYRNPKGDIKKKAGYDLFCAYFNDDYGSGKFRGIYTQGNEALRPIFRAWLAPFQDLGASTVALGNAGGTDHLSFDGVGLPGFQFIQDPIEYGRTYHTNMDTYERISEEDIKQSAVIMAAFAYNAATRPEKLPRKSPPLP